MNVHQISRRFSVTFLLVTAIIYILMIALGSLVIMFAHEPTAKVADYTLGCHINAISLDDGKDTKSAWEVLGWVKFPNVKLMEKEVGQYPRITKAADACEEWMEHQKEMMPIPLGEPPENGKKNGEVKYARKD